ncbi:hypothetical protein ScPMuIL_003362 [Solemya velum]
MEVLSILLLISACISITWSSNVIDLRKEKEKRIFREQSCLNIFRHCFKNADTPRRRRYCVLLFSKCTIEKYDMDDGFQSLRREYKEHLDFFQGAFEDAKWW